MLDFHYKYAYCDDANYYSYIIWSINDTLGYTCIGLQNVETGSYLRFTLNREYLPGPKTQ